MTTFESDAEDQMADHISLEWTDTLFKAQLFNKETIKKRIFYY